MVPPPLTNIAVRCDNHGFSLIGNAVVCEPSSGNHRHLYGTLLALDYVPVAHDETHMVLLPLGAPGGMAMLKQRIHGMQRYI